jgi:periplasmic protein TonB
MRSFALVLLGCIYFAQGYAQTGTNSIGRIAVEITKEKKPKRIYATVEIIVPFPGGDSSWIASLEKTLNQSMPYKNGAKPGKYIVSVVFIVDKQGDISDIRSVNDPVGFGMEEQVLRVLKKKSKWLPASQGVPVRPYRTSSSTPPGSN